MYSYSRICFNYIKKLLLLCTLVCNPEKIIISCSSDCSLVVIFYIENFFHTNLTILIIIIRKCLKQKKNSFYLPSQFLLLSYCVCILNTSKLHTVARVQSQGINWNKFSTIFLFLFLLHIIGVVVDYPDVIEQATEEVEREKEEFNQYVEFVKQRKILLQRECM